MLRIGEGIRHVSLAVWVLAAAGAVGLHFAGGALAYVSLADQDAEGTGALAIDIDLDFLAPHGEYVDAKLDRVDQNAQNAQVAVQEQKAEVKEVELPKDTPTQTDDPDRIVSANPTEEKIEQPDEAKTPQKAQD